MPAPLAELRCPSSMPRPAVGALSRRNAFPPGRPRSGSRGGSADLPCRRASVAAAGRSESGGEAQRGIGSVVGAVCAAIFAHAACSPGAVAAAVEEARWVMVEMLQATWSTGGPN
ncbi:unnamed protein product [Ostreobium quekettii]|uniref:Uncharacterized protein n=1 Tax=Ostreobium quekettii TaxID=121088 RepID=A0A8S1IQ23_9CHLO|nr:unnamed protein product [Ostreobium quekettii]